MRNMITKGMILKTSSNSDVYARGEKYYRDGKLLSIKTVEQDGAADITAMVEGNYKEYKVTLRLDAQGQLKFYACNCESHNIWRGACKHVVAALFAVAEGVYNSAGAIDAMQRKARALTDTIERLIFQEIEDSLMTAQAPSNPVRLAPCLRYDKSGELSLTCTVGYTRMYVVRNIPAFVNSVKLEETVAYGSGLHFCHALSVFDEQSRALIAFLMQEETIYQETAKRLNKQYRMPYGPRENVRALPLTERNIDKFFDLYADREVEAEIDGSTQLRFVTQSPEISLHIVCEEGKAAVTASLFSLRIFNGQRFRYFISKNTFCRMPLHDAQILVQMIKALSEASEIIFTGDEQQRFLSVILPKLQKMGVIASVTGDTSVQQVTGMQPRLYFDSDGRDVSCQVLFYYGDTPVNPLETKSAGLLRDSASEYKIKRLLTGLGFVTDTAKKIYKLTGNDAIYFFLNGSPPGIDSLREHAEIFVTDTLQAKTVRAKQMTVGLRLKGNLLDVNLQDSAFTAAELLEAIESYQAHKKYHRLKDGRFLPLDDEHIAPVAEMVAALDVTKKEVRGSKITVPAFRALYLEDLIQRQNLSSRAQADEPYKDLIHHFKDDTHMGFALPPALTSVLREYQKTGYQWLKVLAHYGFGGILADDMGLGKTLQVIAVLLSEKKPGTCSLVVAPTSLLYNWENEIKKFAPQLTALVVSGVPEKRKELLQTQGIDVFITTYDMMKRDTTCYENRQFAYLIADEAQNIKNPSTQNAKAIKEIKATTKYALTGTPIENTLTELWSIFDFIMPGYLHSAHKFTKLYEYPIVKHNDANQASRLRRQISPFVLRRTKKNVLTELPDKTETTLLAELLPEQRKIYMATLLKARGELEQVAADSGNRIKILTQLTRLRQICCHPKLFAANYHGGSGKLAMAVETVQMAVESGHRLLLFSQFTSMLEIIKEALDKQQIAYFYLEGATSAQSRADMSERFNAGERDVFLISLKAGGTGLNLIGADVVIHYDPWWNPSVMNQASDRAHRFGQEKAVQIFNIVAKDTIEEKIMALQEKKRDLIDTVITEGGSFINTLTEEEIRALFASM